MGHYTRRTPLSLHQTQREAHYVLGLHNYVQYGLEMRKLLEHTGPYDSSQIKADNLNNFFHIGSIKTKSDLQSHQTTYLRLSGESIVVSAIALFELSCGKFFE